MISAMMASILLFTWPLRVIFPFSTTVRESVVSNNRCAPGLTAQCVFADRSPLENLHAFQCFDAMRQDSCNILKTMETSAKKHARKMICDAIIGTDMAFHKKHVDDMAAVSTIDVDDAHSREELMSVLVHLCDIGASTFEWEESTVRFIYAARPLPCLC